MRLRRDDVCRSCADRIEKGTEAYWDEDARNVTCLRCLGEVDLNRIDLSKVDCREIDRGDPGASAVREHRRRRANREARTRSRHPLIGRAIIALSGSPQHERAWVTGGHGEQIVGRSLDRRTAKGPTMILHDRRMPRSRANIDHLAIAPSGVYVIDTKAIAGRVRVSRPLFGKPMLTVKGRHRPKLVAGLEWQVDAVRRALAESDHGDIAVFGVLCFTKADLPRFGAGQIRGVRLHHCRATARKLNRSGPCSRETIEQITQMLGRAFPRA
ncbi:MAG TPA: nuclease-related domain-containing protein [Solirubrobacteraceae bacterium]|nr:nuclease-related domain-containing protein [Solirubrobacteraceae bacterium]